MGMALPPPGVPRHHLLTQQLAPEQLELAVLQSIVWEQPACGYWVLSTRRCDGASFAAWNVRATPSRSAAIVGSLSNGTVVAAREQSEEGWLRLADGWVLREHDGAGWRQCGERGRAEPARVTAQRFAALCLNSQPAQWASEAAAGDAADQRSIGERKP